MASPRFWLRWSWRDWRARWVQVAIIALIIAIGTGGYAGMISSVEWREKSQTASFEALNMYDLRVRLASGSYVRENSLASAVATIPHHVAVDAAEERLLSTTQVRVETADETILAVGPITGVDVSAGSHVNGIYVFNGRALTEDDRGKDIAVISRSFALYHDLPASGEIQVGGGRSLQYVGQGLSPEYYAAFGGLEQGAFLTAASFAPLFTSLETAQALAGQPGNINDLVITLAPGADREAIAAEIDAALKNALPDTGFEIMRTEDDPAHQLIFDDIKNDRKLLTIFAVLIFLGAVGAAFNLTSRFVDAQRREIGIAMSLGVPRRQIAIRPLLMGAEIALLGVVFGVVVGIVLGQQMRSFLEELQPLPIWNFEFQVGIYAQAAVVGFVLPFLATAIPVIRAVRVPPIRAMQTGARATRGGGLAPLFTWLRIPGTIFAEIPIRNLLRAPRRSLLTVLGIAAAITVLVGLIGTLDSFFNAIDRSDEAATGTSPDRLLVTLNGFYAIGSPEVAHVSEAPSVGTAVPGIRIGADLLGGDQDIGLLLEFIDFGNELWVPALHEGDLSSEQPGIVIAQKAADDLGIGVGDRVTMRHPLRTGLTSFTLVESEFPVIGIHTHPFRPLAYMDIDHANLVGLAGATNLVYVAPNDGATVDQVKDDMFALDVVTLAQPVAEINESIEELVKSFTGVLQIFEGLTLLLALLIAFNAASINLDERARDYATMFAFGVPIRTVLRMTMIESGLVGIGGTLLGVLGGFLVIGWIINVTAAETLADIGLEIVVNSTTVVLAAALGILAVAAAPLLTTRKLRHMNISSTLRVME